MVSSGPDDEANAAGAVRRPRRGLRSSGRNRALPGVSRTGRSSAGLRESVMVEKFTECLAQMASTIASQIALPLQELRNEVQQLKLASCEREVSLKSPAIASRCAGVGADSLSAASDGKLDEIAAGRIATVGFHSGTRIGPGVNATSADPESDSGVVPLERACNDDGARGVRDASSSNAVLDHVRPDEWIASLDSGTNVVASVPPSWLSDITPAVKIEQFDGNPLRWDMFIGSFKSLVHDVVPGNAQKLAILRELLSPELRASIAPSLSSPDMYGQALRDLRRLFGSPHVVITACIRKLRSIEAVRPRCKRDIERFYLDLHGALNVLRRRGCREELRSLFTLHSVVQKLPRDLQEKWAKKVYHLSTEATLEHLEQWLEELVLINRMLESTEPEADAHDDNRNGSVRHVAGGLRSKVPKRRIGLLSSSSNSSTCDLCAGEHSLSACPQFLEASLLRRAELVRDLKKCFACLNGNHRSKSCPNKGTCGLNGCNQRHHRLLHGAPRAWPIREDKSTPSETSVTVHTTSAIANPTDFVAAAASVCLAVVPVTISVNGRSMPTHALIDPGSEGTLITEWLVDQLCAPKEPSNIQLSTFHGRDPNLEVSSVSFKIAGCSTKQWYNIERALVVPSHNASHRTVDWSRVKQSYRHLADLPLPKVQYQQVQLLLGVDNFDVIQPLEIRRPSTKGHPFGMKTPLGWTVVGPLSPVGREALRLVNNVNVKTAPRTDEVISLLEQFWSTEGFGTKPFDKSALHPDEDDLRILSSSTSFVNGRYEVGLLWRNDCCQMPNNRRHAMKRFMWLRKKLRRDEALRERYDIEMSNLVRTGVARKLASSELNQPIGKVWYLPHHAVHNQKASDKVRVVFDASAEFEGVSLNSMLVKGPDLGNDLVTLLFRFRLFRIPVSSDIKAMYHQVAVPTSDQSVLRYLWSESEDGPPLTFQMTRQVFGLTSAPSCCIFALQRCIDDHAPQQLASYFKQHFYVDNYLDSFQTAEKAVSVSIQLKNILRRGGFQLLKWSSSSSEVMAAFEEEERAYPTHELAQGALRWQSVLGLQWNSESDAFRYSVSIDRFTVVTKRRLFSALSKLFDPLGLVAPVVLEAKLMMRDATYAKIGWDDPIGEDLVMRFNRWTTSLEALRRLSIPRWLGVSDVVLKFQVHIFVDASERAFGAVAYARLIDEDNRVNCSLLLAKSRLAPRKVLSIPRLELQAAVLGVRIGRMICEILDCQSTNLVYWTDSMTVVKWLHLPMHRLKTFVANRVSEILDNSQSIQWRHVPGAMNPADEVSRGTPASLLSHEHRWFTGPSFLYLAEDDWPVQSGCCGPSFDPEVKEEVQVGTVATDEVNAVLRVFSTTSDFEKAIRIVGYLLRFATRRSQRHTSMELSAIEVANALTVSIRMLQMTFFTEEYRALKRGKPVHPSSVLASLSPFIDKNGILRIGGRLHFADLPMEAKHPTILPKSHDFVHRLIWKRHVRLMHAGVERVLSDLRAEFWLLGGRRTVRRIIDRCLYCRRMRAKAQHPMMAHLPPERIVCSSSAFVNVGIDCFGPFTVAVKRSHVKRYGCIFTCLVSRASHLEMLHSMDVQSFIMALRRFIARRGQPQTIFSDNGRNFVGAQRIVCEKMVQDGQVMRFLADRRIEWKFIPPGSPHFGGSWERLIGIAKRALAAVLSGNIVTEEVLMTVFAEVESLLNGRPLAYIGSDPTQPEPLTPFLLLTGRANVHVPPDVVCEPHCTLKAHWRQAAAITDKFWRRWHREVLPTLQGRTKWQGCGRNLRVDDVVIVFDPTSPRGLWPIGRIVEIMPGPDGKVRVAVVKTKYGLLKRSVSRLALLESVQA